MGSEKYTKPALDGNVLNDDAAQLDLWKAAEERNLIESLKLSYTERFRIMTRLMRIGNMLSSAKVTHKTMT
jgi:hypothetical protein